MGYDELFDRLCDVLVECDSTPQDVLDATLAVLLIALHKVPDRELGFRQVEETRRVYLETFGSFLDGTSDNARVH